MFKKQYSAFCDSITPSQALTDETLALMQEAQNHRAVPPNVPLKWKNADGLKWRPAVFLPVAATALAATVALVITGVWLTRGGGSTAVDEFSDVLGSGEISDSFADEEDVFESIGNSENANSLPSNDKTADNTELPTDEAPAEDSAPEGSPNSSKPSSGADNTGSTAPDEPSSEAPSDAQSGNTGNALPSDPSEEVGEDKNDSDLPQYGAELTPETEPYGPEISTEKNIKTYLSVREFIDALAAKETPNYGKNYYNTRELLIIPNLLPDGARFRHLQLNTRNGKYSYSYHFVQDGKDYLIDVEVNAVVPKNLNELRLYKDHIVGETILTGKKDDQLFYQFGERDVVTVTLTDATGAAPLTEEETAALLTQFKLERCSLNNPVLDMKY